MILLNPFRKISVINGLGLEFEGLDGRDRTCGELEVFSEISSDMEREMGQHLTSFLTH